ncbi:MAG: ATP-binding protein [Thermodesulfobacteriota bacterium]
MADRLRIALILCLLLAASTSALAQPPDTPLRIGLKIGSPPFTYLDQEGDHSVRGLSVDLGRLLGKAMGRRVEFFKSMDLVLRRELLTHGQIDLIIFDSPNFMAESGFIFVPTSVVLNRRLFAHNSCRDVVCLKDLADKRVIMVAGDDLWQLRDQPPPRDLTVVATPLEALEHLEKGHVDVFIAPSEEVAQAFILKRGFRSVRKVGVVIEQIPLYITLRQDQRQLASEIATAMKRIKASGSLEKIKDKWFGVDFAPPTWEHYRDEMIFAAALVLSVLLGIVVWNRQLKAKVRQVTQGLQSSERKFRNVIDSSPDMILVLDRLGRIHSYNPSAANILDGRAEKPGMTFVEALPAGERDRAAAFLREVFEQGRASAGFHLNGARGGQHDIDVAATRVTDHASGEPLACCFARDMTERNRMEQELVQADRLATIGKMAASVAHEINNPLGIIQANVELVLGRGLFPEEAREFLEAIRRNTVRAGNITRDLLTTARPNPPRMGELDLHLLAQTTLSMIAPQFADIRIVHQTSEWPVLVWGDSSLLQQVLINVLLNAKAALSGTPEPHLEIRYCHPAGGSIRVLVLDNGKGIAREHLNAVFEPFFTTGKPEGFGLGLFISRRIVEDHGGVMYVESEVGRGTRIIIELPAAPEGAAERAEKVSA